jgi:2-deoxy-D-gluconate 3-dehydrogenase
MALALAAAGASVAVAARTRSQLVETAAEIERLGRRALAVVADVRDPASVAAMVGEVVRKFGRLDVLVNAAGVNRRVPSLELTPKVWDEVVDTNLKGTFFASQAAAQAMLERGGGKIINIASLASELGLPGRVPYTAAKSGVLGLTRALAVEWAPHNIQVNAIGPGYFRTEMTEPLFRDAEWMKGLLSRIPAGRAGLPEDLAGAVVFLASRASDYITGQIIYVDGGFLAGWPDRPQDA